MQPQNLAVPKSDALPDVTGCESICEDNWIAQVFKTLIHPRGVKR